MVTLVSPKKNESIKNAILNISEIVNVDISAFHINDIKKNEAEQLVREETTATVQTNDQEDTTVKTERVASKTIRVNIDRLDHLMNLFEELVIDKGRLEQISHESNNQDLQETVERMSRVSGDLQNIILNMRMVPVEQVFNRFPRMVRQLSRDLGKKIKLVIVGAETELDRTVIDEIGDPLVHLIRNSLDHGIETPEERLKKGKPEEGTVTLKAYHSGNHVFIEIRDDGAGISRDKVLQKAKEKGIVSSESAAGMSDQQIFELIMSSGFSTANKISDISGRGVGLDVVKNTIESLGGTIAIDSKENEGSHFSIQLPLTLSIISAMLVDVKQEKYAIPLSSIIETALIPKKDIRLVNNQKVVDFRNRVIPLVSMSDLFKIPANDMEVDKQILSVVVARKGDKMAGLIVDTFLGQQEIVLKSLGIYLKNVFAISGATILGNGQVALILDPNALIK